MFKLKRIFLSALIAATTARATEQSKAPPFRSVHECVTACESALHAADETIGALNIQIGEHERAEVLLQNQLNEAALQYDALKKRDEAWYRDPFIIGVVTFVGGLVLGVRATK